MLESAVSELRIGYWKAKKSMCRAKSNFSQILESYGKNSHSFPSIYARRRYEG